MAAHHPSWLQSVLKDPAPAPQLFAWTTANLGSRPSPKHASIENSDNSLSKISPNVRNRIFILGLGNLGILFATALAKIKDGPPITLVVHRRELLESWAADPGLRIMRNGIVDKSTDFDVEWWSETEPTTGPRRQVAGGNNGVIANLLVTTKATVVLPQVDRLRRYLDGTSTVAFAQNGMSKMWPPHGDAYNAARYPSGQHPNWVACVTTHGVTSQGRFKSVHASVADLKIGPVLANSGGGGPDDGSDPAWWFLAQQFGQAPHLHARRVSRRDLWVLQLEKLVVNAVINPLTAILRCKNGDLFKGDPGGPVMRLIDILLVEASGVLQRLIMHESADSILSSSSNSGSGGGGGSSSSSSNTSDTATSRAALVDRFSHPRLRKMLLQVGEKVKENTSSMLQDVRAGKGTEVRDFNGWLVETAEFLGCEMPVDTHATLISLVENNIEVKEGALAVHFPVLATK